MYRHLLVATDGSPFSARAIRTAIALAKTMQAKLTGLYVVAPYFEGDDSSIAGRADFERAVRRDAQRHLAAFDAAARRAGITATATSAFGGQPWKAILKTARARRCDLIVMASHGRSGLAALLLGSQTTKVLTHSRKPVLVCR
jgi:nucleotide-binding universal stress UspA family protein